MELYLLGSLLGLGYYLNSNAEVKKKELNYPKKMYRGNIYDNEQYDRVENEIFDRASIKFKKAQNIYENNIVGQYTPDVLFNKESEYAYSRTIEDFTNGDGILNGVPNKLESESEFGESIRKDFYYIDENGSQIEPSVPRFARQQDANKMCASSQFIQEKKNQKDYNINKYVSKGNNNFQANKTVKADNALNEVSNNEIKCWNDDGGIETHTDLEEQFRLLEKGGAQGVKQTYEEPWHNNMVPFFGGTIKQNVDPLANETKLNMYTGQWDYSRKQKQEIAPMFAPEKDIRNVYGDQQFLQNLTKNIDRYIPSLMRTNETPTEKLFVAPGLNLGYNENPNFGFHDPVRVLPKTTNEIRAKNKPKLTYDRPVISGKSLTQEGTKRLNVNKNLPELVVYNEKGERNFGAKSVTLGESGRPTNLLGRAIRSFSRYFVGTAKDTTTNALSSRTAYKGKTSRKNYKLNRMGIAAPDSKKHRSVFVDNAKKTRRQTIEKNEHKGYLSSIITALTNYVAPPKQTIKETTLSSAKPINISSSKKHNTLRAPENIAKRTIRETTEINTKNGHLRTSRKVGKAYDPNDKVRNTLRETTEINTKNGHLRTSRKVGKAYDSNNKARNTLRQTTEINTKNGNIKTTRKVGKAYDPTDKAKTTIKETTELNNHEGNLKTSRKVGKAYDPTDKAKTTIKETTELNNHEGNLKTSRKVGKAYDPTDKAKTTIKETTELNNHEGNLKTSRKVGKAYDPTDKAKTTIKETTELNNHEGNLKTSRKVGKAYDPADKAKTTIKETTETNNKNGNLTTNTRKVGKVYDPEDKPEYTMKDIVKVENYKGISGNTEKKLKVYDPDDIAKYTTRQDAYIEDYLGAKDAGLNIGAYEAIEVDAKYTTRQDVLVENYLGTAGKDVEMQQSYKAAYNAETNELKEKIAEGRAPTQNSVKLVSGVENQCIDIKRIDSDRKNPRGMENDLPNVERVYQLPPTDNSVRITKDKNTVRNTYTDRITPEILDTFRNNPYTQSLNSYAFP